MVKKRFRLIYLIIFTKNGFYQGNTNTTINEIQINNKVCSDRQ